MPSTKRYVQYRRITTIVLVSMLISAFEMVTHARTELYWIITFWTRHVLVQEVKKEVKKKWSALRETVFVQEINKMLQALGLRKFLM